MCAVDEDLRHGVSTRSFLHGLSVALISLDIYLVPLHSFLTKELGGFKSEVQHLQPCKVRRCKAPQDTTSNFSLKSA